MKTVTKRSTARRTFSKPAGPGAPRRRTWVAPLLVAAAVGAAYANSLHGPFVLDDQRAIVQNTSIEDLSSPARVLHPPAQSPITGRPLVNVSFAVNYALHGYTVEGYHVWNVTMHLLAGLVLLGVLRLTLARTPLPGVNADTADRLALLVTLIWVVHPLNTEAVNYVTQRTESMAGLFVLLTLYAAIRALGSGEWGRWTWAAGLAAFGGVTSKESALVALVLVVLWDRTFAFPTFRVAWTERRRLYLAIGASWLMFAFFAPELPFFADRGFEEEVSRWTYLLNQAPLIVRYLRLSFWPAGLVFDYGSAPPVSLGDVWPSMVCVLGLIVATGAALIRVPALGFWGVWFFVALAPASSVIPIPTEVGAERRMYLPLIAFAVIIVCLAWRMGRRLVPRLAWPRAAWTLAAVLVGALSIATAQRNLDYRSGLRIWQTVLDRRPHARAHEHYAIYLRDTGRIEEAISHLRSAAPSSPDARHALASALLEQGDVAGSIAEFREFIKLRPDAPNIIAAREELSVALRRAGDMAGVEEQYRAIVGLAPDYARGRIGFAEALVRTNDRAGALAEYRQALRIQPDNPVVLVNLGLLLAAGSGGQREEAVSVLRRALEVEPRALPARRQLMELFFTTEQVPELEREARALLALAPDDAQAYNMLGIALASQGQLQPAVAAFSEAVRLDPSDADARGNLARASEMLRASDGGR